MSRIILKLSGEALAGEKHHGFDEATVIEVAKQVKQLTDKGTEVGIVIGGGNFWRGRTSETIDRTKADQIGMLATVMNCIYVSEIFRYVGMKTAVLTPLSVTRTSAYYVETAYVPAVNFRVWKHLESHSVEQKQRLCRHLTKVWEKQCA